MGAIEEFGSDLQGLTADIENQFKTLNEMKLKLREQSNTVAGNWSDYFAKQKADLTKAQDALNRISNLPVSETPKIPVVNPGVSTLPKTGT